MQFEKEIARDKQVLQDALGQILPAESGFARGLRAGLQVACELLSLELVEGALGQLRPAENELSRGYRAGLQFACALLKGERA